MSQRMTLQTIVTGLSILFFSCSSEDEKSSIEEPVTSSSREASESGQQSEDRGGAVRMSGRYTNVTYSTSKNFSTAREIDKTRLSSVTEQLEAATKRKSPDAKDYIGLISTKRMRGESLKNLKRIAKVFMDGELAKKSTAKVPSILKLELAMAAVQEKKYAYAEHFLPELVNEKRENPKIRASALNLQGLIAVADDRLPDALTSWEEALKIDPKCDAAQLNLGFYALKYGDFPTATKMLSNHQDDWSAVAGLAVAERLQGNVQKANAFCDRSIKARPSNKVILVNCAINEWQSNQNFKKASEMLGRAKGRQGGGAELSELIEVLQRRIGIDEKRAAAKVKPDAKAKKNKTSDQK